MDNNSIYNSNSFDNSFNDSNNRYSSSGSMTTMRWSIFDVVAIAVVDAVFTPVGVTVAVVITIGANFCYCCCFGRT